jgi:ElaB/YqjD/DUF883 family membrane-anchored ribosome-binding protein
MTNEDHAESSDEGQGEQRPGAARSAAAKHAQQALGSAKGIVSSARLDEVGAKAAVTVSAAQHLSDAIRKNPLAAIGIAFSAGLLLALLTRS